MRRRALLALSAAALLLLTACAAEAEPAPTGTASADPSPSSTPTPTSAPIVAPTPAFDVTCDDVAAEIDGIVGEPNTGVSAALSLISSSSWGPGPAQYSFQRAGGIACSAGDAERSWEVSIVPDATAVVEGTTSRGGAVPEETQCDNYQGLGSCGGNAIEGEALVSVLLSDPQLTDADSDRVGDAARRLAAAAASSMRETEIPASEITGTPCTGFLTAEQLSERIGEPVDIIDSFGGWAVPAEVYHVVNGSEICYYAAGPNEYSDTGYLMITTLPGGAWAFAQIDDATPVQIEGADAAVSQVDEAGRTIVDLRIGADWIRVAVYDQDVAAIDAEEVATDVVRTFADGTPAP